MGGLLAAVVGALDAGVLVEDAERRVLFTNHRMCALFGLPPEPGQLIGRSCDEAAAACAPHFVDPEGFLARVQDLLAAAQPVLGEQLALSDGRTFARDYHPLQERGRPAGHLWVYRDVSDAVRREAELQTAKHEAERANRAQRDFLAHISHEIRTPLNAMIGLTDLALDGPLQERQRGWLLRARNNADALLDLLSDLLDYSKIEADQLELRFAPFVPARVIEDVRLSAQPRADARKLTLQATVDPRLTEAFIGDAARVRQILLNLVTNAIKYTPSGSVEIEASLRDADAEQPSLKLTVIDTGVGIPKEDHDRIFHRFWRADQTNSGRMSGTGLGLSITRSLTQQMGGRIHLRSSPGRGSRFSIYLPVARATTSPRHSDTPAPRARVMVVDDAPDGREVVAERLRRQGHEVVPVGSGAEAIALARALPLDLILMDVNLPHIDGVEATVRIRNEAMLDGRARVPIVALTAHATAEVRSRCLKAGMDDFATKPVSGEQLAGLVGRWTVAAPQTSAPTGAPTAEDDDDIDLSDLLPLFIDERRADLAGLREASDAGDWTRASRLGHRIKGAALALGIQPVAACARAIERAAADADGFALATQLDALAACLEDDERARG